MQIITAFIGRFHPLLVHLPIGILFLAFIFEFLSVFPKYRKLRKSIQPALLLGALFSIASAGSGYFLSLEGGYENELLTLHRNSGIATAVFASLFYFLHKNAVNFFRDKRKRKMARMLLFILLIVLLSFTGHLGGSLTHGEDYLFDFNSETQDSNAGPSLGITSLTDIDSAILYLDIIEPILKARCYGCHSSKKQKGQLRLDQALFIKKGGKHGVVIAVGKIPDSSALFSRLMLPLEAEHHMPPEQKAQPSSAEIALVQAWIEDGASFEKRVGVYGQTAKIKTYIGAMLSQANRQSIIPIQGTSPASASAIAALKDKGILVIPVGSESNYLSVSFVNAKSASDSDLELLLPLQDQLLWLNLSRTRISAEGLKTIGKLANLTQLNLDYTAVKDDALQSLAPLSKLTSLNLVGTEIGDQGVSHLATLKKLEKIFLYKTQVTPMGIKQLSGKLPLADIDTGGYQLPSLATDTIIFKGPR